MWFIFFLKSWVLCFFLKIKIHLHDAKMGGEIIRFWRWDFTFTSYSILVELSYCHGNHHLFITSTSVNVHIFDINDLNFFFLLLKFLFFRQTIHLCWRPPLSHISRCCLFLNAFGVFIIIKYPAYLTLSLSFCIFLYIFVDL